MNLTVRRLSLVGALCPVVSCPLGFIAVLLPSPVAAQSVAGRPRPVVSQAMSASQALGLQSFLGSAAGAPLLAEHPGLKTVRDLDFSNRVHLQALGALSVRLPGDFTARAAADAGAARDMFSKAYVLSSVQALAEVEAHASAAVVTAALAFSDPEALRGLESAAFDLKAYALYGETVRERVKRFEWQIAGVRSRELAQKLALELQRGLRGPESGRGEIPAGLPDHQSEARRLSRLARPILGRVPATSAAPSLVPSPLLGPGVSAPVAPAADRLVPAAEFSKSIRIGSDSLLVPSGLLPSGWYKEEYRLRPGSNDWQLVGVTASWEFALRTAKDRLARAFGLKSAPQPVRLADGQSLRVDEVTPRGVTQRTYRWNQSESVWYVRTEILAPSRLRTP